MMGKRKRSRLRMNRYQAPTVTTPSITLCPPASTITAVAIIASAFSAGKTTASANPRFTFTW